MLISKHWTTRRDDGSSITSTVELDHEDVGFILACHGFIMPVTSLSLSTMIRLLSIEAELAVLEEAGRTAVVTGYEETKRNLTAARDEMIAALIAKQKDALP